MPCASLFDLCLKTIDDNVVNYHEPELPEEIFQAIEQYVEFPVRQIYPERFSSEAILQLATTASTTNEVDLYWLSSNPRSWLIENWRSFIGKIIKDLPKNTKQKIAIFKLLLNFFYENSGLLTYLSRTGKQQFIRTVQQRFLYLLTIEALKWFDDEDHHRFEELWADTLHKGSVKIDHKCSMWQGCHKDIKNRFHLIFVREYPIHTNIEAAFQSDPHDVFKSLHKSNYLRNVMEAVKRGFRVEGWNYYYRCDRFGYWWDQWFYNDNLVYEEGYDDYHGGFTNDRTIEECTGEEHALITFGGFLFNDCSVGPR